MEHLKKLLGLAREHYEKVILGLALLALALSGFLLANEKQKEEEALKEYVVNVGKTTPFAYKPADLSNHLATLRLAPNPVSVNFSPPHNLFNPVKWLRRPDGSLIKVLLGNEIGAEALVVTKITPLHLVINLDKAPGSSGSGYFVSVAREAATNLALRKKIQSYVSLASPKDRTGAYLLKEAKGTPESPEVVLEVLDNNEKVTLTTNAPTFQRVEGYEVDLSYPPEKTTFVKKRLNDMVALAGETNSVIAITADEVVLLNQSNNKRTPLKYNAAP